jgi:ribonuclease P protein component
VPARFGRIRRSAEFEQVLRVAPRARSRHFVLHHWAQDLVASHLSTGQAPLDMAPVDDLPPLACLGAVVPKRHARRSVTRNAVRRLIREAAGAAAPPLTRGLWVVRLRAPIDRTRFVSATSHALVATLREELAGLFRPVPPARRMA